MRLGIDISAIPYGTGVARYTANLVRALVPLMDQADQLLLFGSSLRQKKALHSFISSLYPQPVLSLHSFPPALTSLVFNSLHVNISRFTGPLDVFHAWDWNVPSVTGTLISTVHDLALFKFPNTAHPDIKKHHQQTLSYLKDHASQIIAVSNSTQADLVNLMQFDPVKITVIPEALPAEHAVRVTASQVAAVQTRLGITKPYFLMVGTQEKRKNYPLQINAWQHFKKDFQLVIVGSQGNEPVQSQPGIILCDRIDGESLACLYAGSRVLLYASLYEGFGLPVLEAFFHGTPVVTSNVSSLPEVAGNAAILVNPQEVESIIIGLGKALQARQPLVALGLERLKAFSWASVAHQTLSVYHNYV